MSGCEIARCPFVNTRVCMYVRTVYVYVRGRLPPQVRRGPPHVVGSPAAAENKAHVRHAAAHYAHVVLPAVASWEPLPDMPDDVCHLGAPGIRLQHVLRAACKDIRGMAHQQGCVGGEDMRVCVCVGGGVTACVRACASVGGDVDLVWSSLCKCAPASRNRCCARAAQHRQPRRRAPSAARSSGQVTACLQRRSFGRRRPQFG